MKNGKIDTTSSLRRKRNTYSVFCDSRLLERSYRLLQTGSTKDAAKLGKMFRKILNTTDLRRGSISGICNDLIPFCEYLTEIHGVTDIAGITRSHVESYITAIRNACEAGDNRSLDVCYANMRITGLSIMCMYLQQAGVVAEDYYTTISLIPYPDGEDV